MKKAIIIILLSIIFCGCDTAQQYAGLYAFSTLNNDKAYTLSWETNNVYAITDIYENGILTHRTTGQKITFKELPSEIKLVNSGIEYIFLKVDWGVEE